MHQQKAPEHQKDHKRSRGPHEGRGFDGLSEAAGEVRRGSPSRYGEESASRITPSTPEGYGEFTGFAGIPPTAKKRDCGVPFAIILISCWEHFGSILGRFCDHFEIKMSKNDS